MILVKVVEMTVLWEPLKSPMQNLLLKQRFFGWVHVKAMFRVLQEWLEDIKRTTSDFIVGQFSGWLFFTYTSFLISCKYST